MIKLHTGDVLKRLAKLPDESVQCVVTSPPYWGLRDYGTATWEGGDPACDHEVIRGPVTEKYKVCKCGARRIDAQLGLEPTPEAFVANMVRVFAEVKRVLRPDGTCWVNLGDSYATQSPIRARNQVGYGSRPADHPLTPKPTDIGLKTKDLVGIPWRVAFALQADGWYLRSDIIWHKPNPMPESVRDRPTKSHEYLFLLTKRERYYYDAEAIREAHVEAWRGKGDPSKRAGSSEATRVSFGLGGSTRVRTGTFGNDPAGTERVYNPAGRNARSVWTITPKPFKGAHFATFPPALVERCVKAGTSERGACPHCGKPWERVTETHYEKARGGTTGFAKNAVEPNGRTNGTGMAGKPSLNRINTTICWRPTCSCGTNCPIPKEDLDADPSLLDDFEVVPFPPVPCVVLDPFSGAGTVALVAQQLGRDAIGIDLNPAYNRMARKRIAAAQVQHTGAA